LITFAGIHIFAKVKVQGTPAQQKQLAEWLSKSLGTTVSVDTTTGYMSIGTGGNASATRLRNMINDTTVDVTLQIVENDPLVWLGGFQPGAGGVSTGTQQIDINDFRRMGNVSDYNGFTPDMILMHEITEVYSSVKENLKYEGANGAHSRGIGAEVEEMGEHGCSYAGERTIRKGDTIFLKILRPDSTYIIVGTTGWGLNPIYKWYREKVPCKFDSGLIAIADPGNNFPVLSYDNNMNHHVLINNLDLLPNNPTGTAFDPQGNIYITEDLSTSDQIRVYNPEGVLINMIMEPQIVNPTGIDIDKETGEIFVSVQGSILRYNHDFVLMGQYFTPILDFLPTDVAIFRNKPTQDKYGDGSIYDIFVTDRSTNQVFRFNTNMDMNTGTFREVFGMPFLNAPEGISVDSWWNIWVASTGNHRIYTFTIDGIIIPNGLHDYFIEDPIMQFNDMQMVDYHGLYVVGGNNMIPVPGLMRYDYNGVIQNVYGFGTQNPSSLAISFFPNSANLIQIPDPCPFRDSLIITPAGDMMVICDPIINMEQLNIWLSSNGGAVADPSMDTVFWSNNYTGITYTCGKTGYATVTFRATDICGNYSETTATFTIVDPIPPMIACPPDQIRNTDPGYTTYTAIGNEFDPLNVHDNCCLVTPNNSINGGTTLEGVEFPVGNTAITWTVIDSCGNASLCTFNVLVNELNKHSISGKTRYAGKANAGNPAPNPPTYNPAIYNIDNVIVKLKTYPDGIELARDTSDINGFYRFDDILNGEYILSYDKYTTDSMQWGNGIDAIDITLLKYYIGADSLSNPSRCFSSKYKKAGNVDNYSTINAVDISRIKAKIGAPYNHGKNFPKGNWVSIDTSIIITGSNLNINLKTICYGDYNASSIKYRDSLIDWDMSKSVSQNIIAVTDDYITTSNLSYFEVPLSISTRIDDFSALGLELNYPGNEYELVSAYMPKANQKNAAVKINPTLNEIISDDNDLLVTDENGVIRVVFATTDHFNVNPNDEIIRLGFRPIKGRNQGNIDFDLSGTGVIGNQYGEENEDAFLTMPKIFVQGNNTTDEFVFTGFPNPFNGEATLSYTIPENGTVKLSVYNALGERISELVNEMKMSGQYTVSFSPKDLPAGMYTFKLDFSGKNISKCMILKLLH